MKPTAALFVNGPAPAKASLYLFSFCDCQKVQGLLLISKSLLNAMLCKAY
jgi:hypothetical protein